MAKIISYKFLSAEIDRGTEDNPIIEQVPLDALILCRTQADYDASYPIAEKEALPGTIVVSGEFDPEPESPSVWDELDAAYQAGYNEGYTEGVNTIYDQ